MSPGFQQRRSRQFLDVCCDGLRWLAWQTLSGLVAMGSCSACGHVVTPEDWTRAVGPVPRRGDTRLAREAREGIRQIEAFLGDDSSATQPKVERPPKATHPTAPRGPRRHRTS